MSQIAFDPLDCFEQLKEAGMPEIQARAVTGAIRRQGEAQAALIEKAIESHGAQKMQEMATKGDIQDVRQEIQGVRQGLRREIQDVRLEVKDCGHDVLKWMLYVVIAQTALIVAVIGLSAIYLADRGRF